MFRRPTVIVVGAGASYDLGFPLGDQLRYKISAALSEIRVEYGRLIGPNDLLSSMRSASKGQNLDINAYVQAAEKISSHVLYARSIDEFVDHFQDQRAVVELSKIAICKLILESEKKSKIFAYNVINNISEVNHGFLDKNDVWLKQIWYMMREGVPRHRPIDLFHNLTFINFNYDRSLETFLTRALTDMFSLSVSDAENLISNAPIYHPYGKVGRLTGSLHEGAPYGGHEQVDLWSLAQGIRTYCESEDSAATLEFQQLLANAAHIVFLGFAYRQLNLDLLKSVGDGSIGVYGTSIGIPDENHDGIISRLSGVLTRTGGAINARLRPVKSAELLRLYEEPLIG